jgi:hypothetical protein
LCRPLAGAVEHLTLRQLDHLQMRLQFLKLFVRQARKESIRPVVAEARRRCHARASVPARLAQRQHQLRLAPVQPPALAWHGIPCSEY